MIQAKIYSNNIAKCISNSWQMLMSERLTNLSASEWSVKARVSSVQNLIQLEVELNLGLGEALVAAV